MKTLSRREIKYTTMPVEQDVNYYVTSDEKEFKLETEAIKHEKMLSIPTIDMNLSFADNYRLIYVNDFDEILIKMKDRFIRRNIDEINKLEYPCWICMEGTFVGYIDLDYSIIQIEDFKESMEETIKEYHAALEKLKSMDVT